MPAGAWFRSLLAMRRSKGTSRTRRFVSDSLVPRLSIKRLEERLVLNADVAPVEVLVVNAGDAAGDGQTDVYHIEQVESEIRVSVNGEQVQSVSTDRVAAIHITGSADNDVLVADLLAGVELIFDGAEGQDTIVLESGNYDRVSYELNGDANGTIDAHSATGIGNVHFANVEHVRDSLTAGERTFHWQGPEGSLDIGESPGDSYGSRLVASVDGITIDFLSPSESLRIDTARNGVADRLVVDGLEAGFSGDLHIAGDAEDSFELRGDLNLGVKNLTIDTGSVVVNHSITTFAADVTIDAATSVTIESKATLANTGGSVNIAAPEITMRGTILAAGGFVSLDSGPNGVTQVFGLVDVAHSGTGSQGGEVHLLGQNVQLIGSARIDASGHSGGGTVLVGGGRYGNDSLVRNSQYTYVGRDVVVNVDAVFAGFGGTAVFWADHAAAFYGTATARGGMYGGDGGFVEISGKQSLQFNGWADAKAVAGNAGTVLFDPTDIVIHDGNGGLPADDALLPDLSAVPPGALNLSETALEALAAASNIVLIATNNITLNDLTDDLLDLATTGAGSLTITADSDNVGGGTFILQDVNDTIQTAGGDITINGNTLSLGGLNSGGGDIAINGAGAVTLNSAITTIGGSFTATADTFDSTGQEINTVGGNNQPGGAVQITTTGQLTTGPITTSGGVDGGGPGEAAGNVSLTGGDITVLGAITAVGSDNNGGPNNGGAGGTVSLNATDGTPAITLSANINTSGGTGTAPGAGGNVTFNDPVTVSAAIEISAGTGTITTGSTLATGANSFTLTADEIDFNGGPSSVSGTGALLLQPSADGVSIDIGSPAGFPNTLDLSDSDLAALADGFATITIGRVNGEHDIAVGSSTFRDNIIIRTPDGGSIAVTGLIESPAGGGSITLQGDITLDADIVTAGFAINLLGDVTVASNATVLLDSTDGGTVAAGANIDISGSLNGSPPAILTETLRINAGTGGVVTLDDVGDAQPLNLTIVNSNSTTISGTVDVLELTIQDTTVAVVLEGNSEIDTLTTTVQPYAITMLGGVNEISTDTNFLNTGAVTLGNAAGDVFLFDDGISTTGGPSQLNLFGQLRTSGDQIDLGSVVLQGTSQIDSTNNGSAANGANINTSAITGNNRSLTISAGSSGDATLTTVAVAGASLAALTVNANTANLTGNVFADSQDYNADVTTSALLDTTDGGGNPAGGMIDIAGDFLGISPQLNAGTAGAITINSTAGTTTLTSLTIVNSGSTTISGAVSMTTLDIQDTTNTVVLEDNVTLVTLTTAAQGYGVSLLGSSNLINSDTDFLNTGVVTLGNNAGDVFLFNGGINTTTGPSQTRLFGQLRTSGDQIDLSVVNLQGDSRIDATNNGGVATGAPINLNGITGGNNDLDLDAGTTGAITVAGNATGLGALTLTQTTSATFQGSLTATSLVTTAQPYSVTLLGSNNSVTNDTNFLNTGTLTLGDAATDVFLFSGGMDATGGPAAFNLFGRLRTSANQIDLAAVNLLGNSEIDATNAGTTPAGADINVGIIAGANLALAMNAGTSGDVNLVAIGAPAAALASFQLSADTATLTANIVANTQNYVADLIISDGLNLLLDTTNGGLSFLGGNINVTGSINGTTGGAAEGLLLDGGLLGTITLDEMGTSTTFNAAILNSGSTTIAGPVTLGVLNIVDTTFGVSIEGDAAITALLTSAQPYDISLLGSTTVITLATTFQNTGVVILGDAAGDVLLFDGGINTAAGPLQTNLFGQLRTSGDLVNLGALILQGDSAIDATNDGGVVTGASINIGTITGVGHALTFDGGTAGNIAFAQVGSAGNAIGDLVITMANNVTATGTIDAASLVQTDGAGITHLQGNVFVSDALDLTTGTIRLLGPGGGVNLLIFASTIDLNAIVAFNIVDVLFDTTTNPNGGGRISDLALSPAVLAMTVNAGLPLAPPAVTVAEIDVVVNDPLGLNFTVTIDWRFAERPGIPAPPAVIVPPDDIVAEVVATELDGAVLVQLDHQYDDSPEPNPADDINVRVAITEFARGTINLLANGTSILDEGGISTNVVVPVDVPLFGFVLVPLPEALPVTPATPAPVTPFVVPTAPVVQAVNNPFEPNSPGVTGTAEVRYYELRIVSFDANGKLIESPEERINLSDPRLEAIAPFNPSKLPELFKRLPGDRYRIYLIEDGAERLMIEFVIEQVGDEGRPIELPERLETDGQGARLQNGNSPSEEIQNQSAARSPLPAATEREANCSFAEELGRASFVSSGGLIFGAAAMSKPARVQREAHADLRMSGFRKRLRDRAKQACEL